MKAFAIIEDNVVACPTAQEAKKAVAAAGESEPRLVITSEAELAASPLVVGQLIDIWNGFAGVVPFDDLKPVRKFTDRKTAIARIWKAIQRLAPAPTAPTGGEPGTQGAPQQARSRKAATPDRQAAPAREGSTKAQIIELLRRPEGATLADIAKATGWQNHSIRGFLSGSLGKKMGLKVESSKREDGARAYALK
jgi:hypothetical protein